MNKTLAIATVLMAAALTGIFSTNLIAFAQDELETNTEESIAQENVGSGEITNNNCSAVAGCEINPTPTPTSTGG